MKEKKKTRGARGALRFIFIPLPSRVLLSNGLTFDRRTRNDLFDRAVFFIPGRKVRGSFRARRASGIRINNRRLTLETCALLRAFLRILLSSRERISCKVSAIRI